jgi:hypothetical protein
MNSHLLVSMTGADCRVVAMRRIVAGLLGAVVILIAAVLLISWDIGDMTVVAKETKVVGNNTITAIEYCVRYRSGFGAVTETCTSNLQCLSDARVGARLPTSCR